MRRIEQYVRMVRDNYDTFRPRYNDICIECIEELPTKETHHRIAVFVPTLLQNLTKQRATKLKELFGCQEVLLLEDEPMSIYRHRKIALNWHKAKGRYYGNNGEKGLSTGTKQNIVYKREVVESLPVPPSPLFIARLSTDKEG